MKVGNVKVVRHVFPNIEEREESVFDITASWLRGPAIREALEGEVFFGRPIRWREAKKRLSSTFTIAGPHRHVEQVRERMAHWAELRG